MHEIVIFNGIVGSGKSTQAKLFCKHNNFQYISTGDLYRNYDESSLININEIDKIMKLGKLVSDEITNKLVRESMNRLTSMALVFDGYPRTLNQAKFLNSNIKNSNYYIKTVFTLELDHDQAIDRIKKRNAGRVDDKTEEIINERILQFEKHKNYLHRFYLTENINEVIIDADNNIETIFSIIQEEYEKV